MSRLSKSKEDYIETIYVLSPDNMGVRITDIAHELKVSKVSVTNAVKKLSDEGYAIYQKYQNVFLTEDGINLAKQVLRKHKIISRFLSEILDVEPNKADNDACEIEHVISEETLQKMETFINRCKRGECCYRKDLLEQINLSKSC